MALILFGLQVVHPLYSLHTQTEAKVGKSLLAGPPVAFAFSGPQLLYLYLKGEDNVSDMNTYLDIYGVSPRAGSFGEQALYALVAKMGLCS